MLEEIKQLRNEILNEKIKTDRIKGNVMKPVKQRRSERFLADSVIAKTTEGRKFLL